MLNRKNLVRMVQLFFKPFISLVSQIMKEKISCKTLEQIPHLLKILESSKVLKYLLRILEAPQI